MIGLRQPNILYFIFQVLTPQAIHSVSFAKRLYNFTGNGGIGPTPTLDPMYAKCPQKYDNVTTVEMVPGSSTTFDTKYYSLVASRRGLFHSDQVLLLDEETNATVYSLLRSSKQDFLLDTQEKSGRIELSLIHWLWFFNLF